MSETVMIVSGEASGELYGSLLAVSLKKKSPSVRIIGIGGKRMKDAGVELISGIAGAFGIAEAVSSIRAVRETFRKAKEALQNFRPQVLVLIDYPDFNLRLAGEARKHKIKVLYYVSPQVWAWRKRRVRKIARLVDRMAVVLPFEKDIYKKAGLYCEFVGHPVFDEIQELGHEKRELKLQLGLNQDRPLLSLLPGSRPNELDRLLPVLLNLLAEFKKEFKDFQYCVPLAPDTDIQRYRHFIERLEAEGAVINRGDSLRTLSASDCAVVASGTAALQAALLGIPIVVIYKLFPLTYWLGRLIVDIKFISLVNILAGFEIVRELVQSDVTTGSIMQELRKIILDDRYREDMKSAYKMIIEKFSGRKASERVADMVLEMSRF